MRRRGDRPVASTLVNIMMTSDLKPYPAYKDAGIEWLGEVPAHWEVKRIKSLSLVKRGASPRPIFDPRYFSDEGEYAWVRISDVTASDHYLERTTQRLSRLGLSLSVPLQPGSLFLSIAGSIGKPIITKIKCCIHDGFVYFPQFRGNVEFLYRVFLCGAPFARLGKLGTQINLNTDTVANICLGWPSESEQTAIVRFLDHADRRIRRYIRAKQKLIALLEEQKQAIIHQAVTRGIDAAISLKPTGNSWFPEVPDAWDVIPMGRVILRAVDGPHLSPDYLDKGIPFLSARNIKVDRWSLEDVKFISQTDYDTFCQRVKPEMGDVLYTKGGTTGVARAVDLDFPFQVWVHVAVLKVRKDRVLPHYLATVLNTPRCYEQSQLFTRGATNQDLGLGRMKDIVLPLPPLAEQSKIIERVMAVQAQISRGTHAASRQIELLQEHHTRLIADVVTGKLDVREAAAALPEVDPLAKDDLDGTIHDEENSNLGELNAEESAEEYTIEKEMPL